MRKFGVDAPEFLAFTLGDSEEVYKIPLAASMPMTTLLELSEAAAKGDAESMRFQLDLLRRYIGERADDLTAGEVGEIFAAWNEESVGQGATVGE